MAVTFFILDTVQVLYLQISFLKLSKKIKGQCLFCRHDGSSKRLGRNEV